MSHHRKRRHSRSDEEQLLDITIDDGETVLLLQVPGTLSVLVPPPPEPEPPDPEPEPEPEPPPDGGDGEIVTPDVVNNASFEDGWDGFVSGNFTAPSGVARDTARAKDGTWSVKKALPVTDGANDLGSALDFPFYAGSPLNSYTPEPDVPSIQLDRAWARWYFYFDAAIDGTLKFNIWQAAGYGTQFGGVGVGGGNLIWSWLVENQNTSKSRAIARLADLVNGWHSIEIDYWRNGDPSGWPSVAFWLDDEQLLDGAWTPPSDTPEYWENNRYYAGTRASSEKLGVFRLLGLLNGSPRNTVPGNVWVDRVALSSKGRIGA